MQFELTNWFNDSLMPVLLAWPDDQSLRLGAGLIAGVLLSGLFARWALSLRLPSHQGRIALAAMLFFTVAVSLLRVFLALDWQPAVEGLIFALVLAVPCYAIGATTERVEVVVKNVAFGEVRRRGMRDRVLNELRNKQIDRMVYEEALERVGGDESRLRSAYIGLRSRKLARIEASGAVADPENPRYGLIEYDPVAMDGAQSEERKPTSGD